MALLAVIVSCVCTCVWTGKKHTQSFFLVFHSKMLMYRVVGSLLSREFLHCWVHQLWIPSDKKRQNPTEQKAFWSIQTLMSFRLKIWIAEHLTWKHWSSSIPLLLLAPQYRGLCTMSCQSLPLYLEMLGVLEMEQMFCIHWLI